MHNLYALVRLFPYWGIPIAILFGELAWYHHRKRANAQYYYVGGVLIIVALLFMWFLFRGDMNSDQWVRSVSR